MLDEGAPRASADPFQVRGYGVILHQSVLAPGAKDPLVAYTAMTNHAVLIATDRDMKQMARRFGSPNDEVNLESFILYSLTAMRLWPLRE